MKIISILSFLLLITLAGCDLGGGSFTLNLRYGFAVFLTLALIVFTRCTR